MSKLEKIILSVAGLIIIFQIAVYVLNPYNTATWDPRGRIYGHIPYSIPSQSMAPTLIRGDFIITKTYVYASSEPKHKEIIVFRHPLTSIPFVKRVAGIAGDKISINDGTLYINETEVKENYIEPARNISLASTEMPEKTIPENHLFVLGDNRDRSNDSRYWGFVPTKNIIGRVHYIWQSNDTSRIGRVK